MSGTDDCKPCWLWDNKLIALAARLGVGLTFIYLAGMKLQNPGAFLKSLSTYEMLPLDPPLLINAVAIFMPWSELLIGLALVLGVLPRGAAFVAFVMLVAFTSAVLLRGLGIMSEEEIPFMEVAFDCGCGTGVVTLWKKLISNSAQIFASFYLCATGAKLWTLWSLEGKGATSPGTFAAEV